jgi:hypothetical protein
VLSVTLLCALNKNRAMDDVFLCSLRALVGFTYARGDVGAAKVTSPLFCSDLRHSSLSVSVAR